MQLADNWPIKINWRLKQEAQKNKFDMKKNFLSFLFFISAIFVLEAQSTSTTTPTSKDPGEKMFHAIGTTVYLDIYNGPIREKLVTDPYGNSYYDYVRVTGLSYFTFIYHFRYNIREMSDNMAFGVSAFPSIGIFVGGSSPANSASTIPVSYSGCFSFPVIAGMHFGETATSKANYPIGFFVGAGYEFNAAPMVFAKTVKNRDIQTKWFNPCVSIGFKYPGSSNFGNLQEINLKMGFGLVNTDINEPNNLGNGGFVFTKPFTFRISYFTYLKY
jgi:hypothetical protein